MIRPLQRYKNILSASSSKNLPIGMKIWLYFLLFVVIVFVLMWLFQIVFLQQFYEAFKTHDTKKLAQQLSETHLEANFSDRATDIAVQNEMCIVELNANGYSIYQFCVADETCLLHGKENGLFFYLADLKSSNDGTMQRHIFNDSVKSNTLLYGCTLYSESGAIDGYLFVSVRLELLSSTKSVLERQTLIITLILAVVGIAISVIIARSIANPLVRITGGAKRFAHGDYGVTFRGGGYAEADDLADTLNFAATELSKTDQMQRDLIANVSHDLRTPLTMMKAYAEMIRDLSGDNPEKRNQHLNIIIEETDRLSLLVSDMLDLSKLESGTKKLTYRTLDIRACMEEIMHRYDGISDKMGYHIDFTLDKSRLVSCDAGKINRVIGNLINNAINYTSKEDKQVFVTQRNFPDRVRIEVRDTGDGIPEDQLKLIFDQYYRSENHQREVVGTGLGLSIVKAILQMHGYPYGVTSKIGEGSIFWFEILGTEAEAEAKKDDILEQPET